MYILTFALIGLLGGYGSFKVLGSRGVGMWVSLIMGLLGAFAGGIVSTSITSDHGYMADVLISLTGAGIFLFVSNLLEMAFGPRRIDSHHKHF